MRKAEKAAVPRAAAARDGARVAMVGAVGRDAMTETALTGLRAAEADLSRLAARETPTGCASVCTDSEGRNQIIVALGANILASDAQVEDALLAPGNTLVTQMEADPASTARLLPRGRVEWADGGQRYHRPAPRTQVRDTTAAGDCFVGVLAAALDQPRIPGSITTIQHLSRRTPDSG